MSIYSYPNSPYTYFLKWTATKKKYYGCQYGKNANPANILSHKYKTSSKYVWQHWVEEAAPDVIEIHRTFQDKEECLLFEHTYLKQVNAVKDKSWLNKTDNKAISTDSYSQNSWVESHKSRAKNWQEDPQRLQAHIDRFVALMCSEKANKKRNF